MARIVRWLCSTISFAVLVLMTVMTLIMIGVVMSRYVWSYSPGWSDEITRYAMVWLVMLGGSVLALYDDHIGLPVLRTMIASRFVPLLDNFIRVIVLLTSIVIARTGYQYSASMWNVLAAGSEISMTFATLAVPVGATLTAAFCLVRLWNVLAPSLGAQKVQLEPQAAFMDGSFKLAEDDSMPSEHQK